MMGASQADAAASVGRNGRTIREWEADVEWWRVAREEARDLWMNDAEDAARQAVLRSMKLGNADMGLRVLERIERRLAPPKQKLEHTGKDGGPIQTEATVNVYIPDNQRGDAG
jgi:hypothetical protein